MTGLRPIRRSETDAGLTRRFALTLTVLALLSLAAAAAFAVAWQLAQANAWTESARSFHVGDPFPWPSVALGIFGSVIFGYAAVRRWAACLALRGRAARERSTT